MKTEQDLDEYCQSLLDIKSIVHKQFLLDLKKRHKLCKFIFHFYILFITLIFYYLVNQKPTSSVHNIRSLKQNSKSQEKEDKVDPDKKSKVK